MIFKRAAIVVILLALFLARGNAFWNSRDSNYNIAIATGGGGCSQATAFNARTSGQNAAHQNANTTFICNLVTEGVFAKLDVAYLFATDTSANALLNVVSSSFNGTANGSPTFTANAGFTGVDASTTVYIDTGFNASTAGGHYSQNSAHASTWGGNNVQAGAAGGATLGVWNSAATVLLDVAPWLSSGFFGQYVNDGTTLVTANSTSLGHYLANRSGASATQQYINGSSTGSDTVSSSAVPNANIYVLAINETTVGATVGSGIQQMVVTIGGSLTAGDVANLCHETNTYLNTIAGVSSGIC